MAVYISSWYVLYVCSGLSLVAGRLEQLDAFIEQTRTWERPKSLRYSTTVYSTVRTVYTASNCVADECFTRSSYFKTGEVCMLF